HGLGRPLHHQPAGTAVDLAAGPESTERSRNGALGLRAIGPDEQSARLPPALQPSESRAVQNAFGEGHRGNCTAVAASPRPRVTASPRLTLVSHGRGDTGEGGAGKDVSILLSRTASDPPAPLLSPLSLSLARRRGSARPRRGWRG